MDETSTRILSSHFAPKHGAVHLLRLFGAVLLACLLLSYYNTPVMAASQPSVSSAFSIPQQVTPGDWSTIHYGGVTLAVPASWPVYDLRVHPERCALFNTHAVYLGQQDPNALCPARALGKSEALQLEALSTAPSTTTSVATAAATIAGISTQVDPSSDVSHTFIVVLKQVGVVIHLSYGQTPNLATHILATLHLSGEKPITPTQTAPQAQPNVTPASQPVGVFNGLGFDACTAPSTSNMSAWLNSPYRAVGIYIGGANRACGDGNLSSSWVHTVTNSGWNLIPFYVGLQAPCNSGFATIDASQAASQGTQGADNAVNLAQGFGLGTGTLLINDMENYDISNASCSQTVMTFLSAWTQELHVKGYLSGVYSSLGSGITDLVRHSGSIQKPDTIDFASWDTVSTTSDPAIPSGDWANHQRMKQYRGGHNATYAGVTMNIDSNRLDTTLSGSATSPTNGVSTASNNGQQWTATREADGHIDLTNGQSTTYLTDTTTATPAITFFKGQVFVAFKSFDNSNRILIDYGTITDLTSCPATKRCRLTQYALTNAGGGNHATSQAPALSSDGTHLYVAFAGHNSPFQILIQQTTDGTTAASWSNTTLTTTATDYAPSTTACDGQQWIAYASTDTPAHIVLASSQATYVLSDTTANAPSIACFKGQVFVSFVSANDPNRILVDFGPLPAGNCTLSTPCHLTQYALTNASGTNDTTPQPPALAADGTHLLLAFVDSTNTINAGTTTDGTTSASWSFQSFAGK